MSTVISGAVAPGFERVRDEFAANFGRDDAYREVGASLAVYRGEALVVDLWGGWRDAEQTTPWTPDTLVNVWSTTKGVTAIAVARLVDQGWLDYAAPVARYWPEFAQNGKAEITVSQLLSHQAGLPGFDAATALADFYDWNTVTGRLAAQAPMWPPGTKNSYHAMTFGFLAGELIRSASGLSVGQFLAHDVAGPLGADVFIGLPQAEEARVSPLIAPRITAAFDLDAMAPEARVALTNPLMEPTLCNARAWRAAEVPAGNGQASARGLARLYAAMANGGSMDGVRLMGRETVEAMIEVQTDRVDVLLGVAPQWGRGVTRNGVGVFGPEPGVFGHAGWGGSFGCGDLKTGLAVGYVLNQMGDRVVGDPRSVGLCEAIYACL
ncbi:serine hydrolase domain-containing protein [Phenylobacterium sp.]|jgi:CubicO group peptidase (beta-lactamase class C family)|uniref:serine hydrolase domain-containing protein n=1 Tax=Phenylobacterium sp. TaxID=1871053 RepID=UPI002F4217D7